MGCFPPKPSDKMLRWFTSCGPVRSGERRPRRQPPRLTFRPSYSGAAGLENRPAPARARLRRAAGSPERQTAGRGPAGVALAKCEAIFRLEEPKKPHETKRLTPAARCAALA